MRLLVDSFENFYILIIHIVYSSSDLVRKNSGEPVAILEMIKESFKTSLCSKLLDPVPYPKIF
jgi:hypothetical protein